MSLREKDQLVRLTRIRWWIDDATSSLGEAIGEMREYAHRHRDAPGDLIDTSETRLGDAVEITEEIATAVGDIIAEIVRTRRDPYLVVEDRVEGPGGVVVARCVTPEAAERIAEDFNDRARGS